MSENAMLAVFCISAFAMMAIVFGVLGHGETAKATSCMSAGSSWVWNDATKHYECLARSRQ